MRQYFVACAHLVYQSRYPGGWQRDVPHEQRREPVHERPTDGSATDL